MPDPVSTLGAQTALNLLVADSILSRLDDSDAPLDASKILDLAIEQKDALAKNGTLCSDNQCVVAADQYQAMRSSATQRQRAQLAFIDMGAPDPQHFNTEFKEYRARLRGDLLNSIQRAPNTKGPVPTTTTVGDSDEMVDAFARINKLVGLEAFKSKMQKWAESARYFAYCKQLGIEFDDPDVAPAFHMAFVGPPGTGKTTAARLVGKVAKAAGIVEKGHVVELSRGDVISDHIGGSEKKLREKFDSAKGGVLFVDEVYALHKKDSPRDFSKEVVDEIVKLMEDYRDEVIVVFAGYREETLEFLSSNPGLVSRTPWVIDFDHFKHDQLMSIFDSFCEKAGISYADGVLERVSDAVWGMLGRGEVRPGDGTPHPKAGQAKPPKHFGNGRAIRNLFQAYFENLRSRVARQITEGETPSAAQATTLRPEDIFIPDGVTVGQ